MDNIDENLAAAMATDNPEDKLDILVTTSGPQPEGFNLKGFEGLDGLYYGRLTHAEIKRLAKDPNVKAVELDINNTVL
jgi:hypothetical protein